MDYTSKYSSDAYDKHGDEFKKDVKSLGKVLKKESINKSFDVLDIESIEKGGYGSGRYVHLKRRLKELKRQLGMSPISNLGTCQLLFEQKGIINFKNELKEEYGKLYNCNCKFCVWTDNLIQELESI